MVEPTRQSLGVYHQYKDYAQDYGLNIRVLSNKVQDQADIDFIRSETGNDYLGALTPFTLIRARDRGETADITMMESSNQHSLDRVIDTLRSTPRNWPRYWEQGIDFHRRNAESWANIFVGVDLMTQVDQDFLQNPAGLKFPTNDTVKGEYIMSFSSADSIFKRCVTNETANDNQREEALWQAFWKELPDGMAFLDTLP